MFTEFHPWPDLYSSASHTPDSPKSASISLHEAIIAPEVDQKFEVTFGVAGGADASMSFAALQTPQKPLPGAFLQTPAPVRSQTGVDPRRQLFRSGSSNGQQSNALTSQNGAPGGQQQQVSQVQTQTQAPPLLPVQRAARTISEVLQRDASFPDLDSYVKRESYFEMCELELTLRQREYPRITTSSLLGKMRHGRHFRKQRCTIYPTKFLSSTIWHRCRRQWGFSQSSIMPGLPSTMLCTFGTILKQAQSSLVSRNSQTASLRFS